MKLLDLEKKLRDVLNILEDYPDDADIELVSNTYFLNGCKYFIGVSGYSGGYVSLDNIEDSIKINNISEIIDERNL